MRIFNRALGVRHHAQHIAFRIENAGNIAARAIAVLGVSESYAAFTLKCVKRGFIGEVIAIMVRDGDTDGFARRYIRW